MKFKRYRQIHIFGDVFAAVAVYGVGRSLLTGSLQHDLDKGDANGAMTQSLKIDFAYFQSFSRLS